MIDGSLYAFQEQTAEDVVMLNGFGTVVNSLGKRVKPYLPQICGTILWRLNNKAAKVRQQSADLISRIANVMKICQEVRPLFCLPPCLLRLPLCPLCLPPCLLCLSPCPFCLPPCLLCLPPCPLCLPLRPLCLPPCPFCLRLFLVFFAFSFFFFFSSLPSFFSSFFLISFFPQ